MLRVLVRRSAASRLGIVLILLLATAQTCVGKIDQDGVCSIVGFAPFTVTSSFDVSDAGGLLGVNNQTNYGFSHLASALLAIDHFNSRNASVVPELTSLGSCNVTLRLDDGSFYDSGSLTQYASQQLYDHFVEVGDFCALVGPFNDYPAVELAAMAQSARIPMVAHRAYSRRLTSNFLSRYTSLVSPDVEESAETLVSLLQHNNRTNYTAFLYSLTETNLQRREFLTLYLDRNDIAWMTSNYMDPRAPVGTTDARTPRVALERVKASGYRTIVAAFGTYDELDAVADAAEELGMNQGDHFWVWFDDFTLDTSFSMNVTKLVHGSALMLPISRADTDSNADTTSDADPFLTAWRSQGKGESRLLNSRNPIDQGSVGYKVADDHFFVDAPLTYGSTFMYDAVMSVGIGACLAKKVEGKVSSIEHVTGIRRSNFKGATGLVRFGIEDGNEDRNGTRLASTVSWGVVNILWQSSDTAGSASSIYPYGDGIITTNITDLLLPGPSREWVRTESFIYRDGRDVPPPLLRDKASQNYLSPGLRVAGFSMMSVVMAASVAFAVWVYVCRNHPVLRASQPIFLLCICFGSLVQASAVFARSFDESTGWDEDKLSAACMAGPWLFALGHVIVYANLFSKLWRVHKVLQFSRREIKVKHVMKPMALLLVLSLLLLLLWTVLDPLQWHRIEIDEATGESIGHCDSDHLAAFLVPLVVIAAVPVLLTGMFAWKTKDVDQAYSESRWMITLFLVQSEVIVVATPLLIILRDSSTDAKYLGYTFLVLTIPASTLALILFPRYLAYREAILGRQHSNSEPKRGQRAHARVSGVALSVPSDLVRASGISANARASGTRGSALGEETLFACTHQETTTETSHQLNWES